MQPLSVQVITYAPTVFRHCQHCEVAFEGLGLGERMHRAEAADALPDDLLTDFSRVSDWVHRLLDRHGPQVAVTVIDAASIEGFWKSLRHRARRYPAVVVDGRTVDLDDAGALIELRLESSGEKGAT
jgi:glutaredoxin